MPYHYALSLGSLLRAFPGNIAQGMIWGIMALGLYIYPTVCLILRILPLTVRSQRELRSLSC